MIENPYLQNLLEVLEVATAIEAAAIIILGALIRRLETKLSQLESGDDSRE